MNVSDIKKSLAKPATLFQTGGFKPTNERGESWIGGSIIFIEDSFQNK